MHTRLAVGRVIVYKSRGVDKTGGPFSKNTSLELGFRNRPFISSLMLSSNKGH
jgi:hypothetical protein